MSVTIIYPEKVEVYNSEVPLIDQLRGCKKVIIDYSPKNSVTEKFLDAMEKLCECGLSPKLNIEVIHNNSIMGAAAKRRVKGLTFDTNVNEIIKMVTLLHADTDKQLEELSTMCTDKCKDET